MVEYTDFDYRFRGRCLGDTYELIVLYANAMQFGPRG